MVNDKITSWIQDAKKRISLTNAIQNQELSYERLTEFIKLLLLNKINGNDENACRICKATSYCKAFIFGDKDLNVEVDVFTESGNIVVNINRRQTSSKLLTYKVSFTGQIGEAYIIDRSISPLVVGTDYIINLICSCILYTIKKYIKRWS